MKKLKYFKLLFDLTNPNIRVVKAVSTGKYDLQLYTIGQIIDDWNDEDMVFETIQGYNFQTTDILINDMSYLIFSNRLKQILESNFIKGIQFLKVNIYPEVAGFSPYWYANVFIISGAFDFLNSKYRLFGDPPMVAGLTKVSIKSNMIVDTDIFRLSESPQGVYVSEKFKSLFESNEFSGAEFLEIKCS